MLTTSEPAARGLALRPRRRAGPRRKAPLQLPLPARCGWPSPAPRLTLQLGRRFAIGLKIAASLPPARHYAQAPRARSSPAARSLHPSRLGSSRPRSQQPPPPPPRADPALRSAWVRAAAMQRRGALFGMPGGSGNRKMAAGDIGELLVPHMPTIRVPRSGDRVYKNECAFSYDSPVSEARRRRRRLGGGSRCGLPGAAASSRTRRHVKRREKMRSGSRGPPRRAPELAQGHCSSANT